MNVARSLQKAVLRRSPRSLFLRRNKAFRHLQARFSVVGEAAALLSKASIIGPKLTVLVPALVAVQSSQYAKGGDKVTDIPLPQMDGHIQKDREYGVLYPAYDEGATKEGLREKLLDVFAVIGDNNQEDYQPGGIKANTHDFFSSAEESDTWRTQVFGTSWPQEYTHVWKEMTTDRGIELFCWFGFTGHFIRKPRPTDNIQYGLDNPANAQLKQQMAYIMPLNNFFAYDVREPYERYGACAFFDKNKNILGIYVSYLDTIVYPNETDTNAWEHAKYVLKTTAMTQVTMQDHLGSVHLIVANSISTAIREIFPTNHPLRGFLNPHLYRTATANSNIPVLLAYYGFFHMSWGLTFDSVYSSIGDFRGQYKFIPVRSFIDMQGMSDESAIDYPFKDSLDLYGVIEEYVTNFINLYYPDSAALRNDQYVMDFWRTIARGNRIGETGELTTDKFIEVVAHFILNGSGFHRHVGNMLPYLEKDNFVGTRISRDQTRQDIQAFAGAGALGIAVTMKEPLLKDDYSASFVQDDKYEGVMNNFRKFQNDLGQLEIAIDEKNKQRAMDYHDFSPKYVGCSVSI